MPKLIYEVFEHSGIHDTAKIAREQDTNLRIRRSYLTPLIPVSYETYPRATPSGDQPVRQTQSFITSRLINVI